jgi:hypothetical protein
VSIPGGGTAQAVITVTGAAAGQVVRIYGYHNTNGMVPRYSISGANTVATSNLPAADTSAPLQTSGRWWYQTDITLTNAGDSTITILCSSTSGHNLILWGTDPAYRTDAGITIHRLAQSGAGLPGCIALALDNTDTQPAGGWIGSGAPALIRIDQTDSMTTRLGLQGVFCSFDVNDVTQSAAYTTIGDQIRHYTNYAQAMLARSVPVIFLAGISLRNPSSVSSAYTQAECIEAARTVARSVAGCTVLDCTRNWGSGSLQDKYDAQVNPTSNWIAGESPNYLHPNGAGHTLFGNLAASLVLGSLP